MEWVRQTDGAEVLDTDDLQLNKSMQLMDTDLGQQLMAEPTAKERNMEARHIIKDRGAYGHTKNFMTPHVVKIVSIKRGEIAAELSYGEGMFGTMMAGVSVARVLANGSVERAPDLSQSFCGDTYSEALTKARQYIEELKESAA